MRAGLIQSSQLYRMGIGLILVSSLILMFKDYLIDGASSSLPQQGKVYSPISPASSPTIQCRIRITSGGLITMTPNLTEPGNPKFTTPYRSANKRLLVNYPILRQQKIPFYLPLLL